MPDFTQAIPGDLVVFQDKTGVRAGEVMRVDSAGIALAMQPFGMRVQLAIEKEAERRVWSQKSFDLSAARLAKVNAFDSFESAKKHLAQFKRKA